VVSRGKKPGKTPPPVGSGRLLRRGLIVLLTLAVAVAAVWGVARLGDAARRNLGPRDRYAVRFADLACDAPPGLDRPAFLAEVRYASGFPETFQSLDPDLSAKLAAAFAAHPWVLACDGASVENDGSVRVKVKFRTPALAVTVTGGGVRVVDPAGILLPASAVPNGLPELVTAVPSPTVSAGTTWTDPVVTRAVELVAIHRPRRLEKADAGWKLTTADGRTLVVGR
jgi:hypothetical protein